MYIVKKSLHNPIFSHEKNNFFEAHAAFNMSVIKEAGKTIGIYRAESSKDVTRQPERISSIGYAESLDGMHFTNRQLLVEPSEEYDKCGCEDPRITFFEGKYYIFYTALSGYPYSKDNIKVAVAILNDLPESKKNTKIIKNKKQNNIVKHLVTPFNAKAFALFPERVNGKVTAVLSVNTDKEKQELRMAIAQADNIEDFWNEKYWEKWYRDLDKYSLNLHRDEYDFYEGGARPVKTKAGWIFIYSQIQNYYGGSNKDKIFGIEALLLDAKNPYNILGRTTGPLIVPTEEYEILGRVENVLFPSGAILIDDGNRKEETLAIYYGAVDAKTCVAYVNLQDLINSILPKTKNDFKFTRISELKDSPLLGPTELHSWENFAVFNPGSIKIGNKVYIFYRAMGRDNTSTVGLAISTDGYTINERLPEPIYVPRVDFESKKVPGGNSGCEDVRVVIIDDFLYMFYTAYNGIEKPAVAVTKISVKNFLKRNWEWDEPFLISPAGFDDKDTCVFPEKIQDKYFVLHRIGISMCGDYIDDLDFEFEKLNKCISVLEPRVNSWDSLKVGIATPPIKTSVGWLVLYHGISKSSHTYRLGAALLDLNDPSYLVSRLQDPIFGPELPWEKQGIVNNVVFPGGAVVIGKYLYIYYGAADKYTGVARIELNLLLKALSR